MPFWASYYQNCSQYFRQKHTHFYKKKVGHALSAKIMWIRRKKTHQISTYLANHKIFLKYGAIKRILNIR